MFVGQIGNVSVKSQNISCSGSQIVNKEDVKLMNMANSKNDQELFENLTCKISHLFLERSPDDWKVICRTLEELNILNYRYVFVDNPIKAVLLINHCCSYIPADEEVLIPKCCQLITNLINFQKIVVEGRTLTVSIQWCLQVLKACKKKPHVILEVLKALDALLRSNAQNIEPYLVDIASLNGPLLNLIESDANLEIVRYSLQCLESCTKLEVGKNNCEPHKLQPFFDKCLNIFIKYLLNPKDLNNNLELKIIIICLRGVENIILHNYFVDDKLGIILGIIKSYMLIGMKNRNFVQPIALLPSTLSIPDTHNNGIREKKGGKLKKQRKQRIVRKGETRVTEEWMKSSDSAIKQDISLHNVIESMPLCQLVTSDSDFSDTEANMGENLFRLYSRVRQMSLSLFFSMAKIVDKRTMFSYWSSFIPENSLLGKHYLTTCILEDPSPRGRTAALNVLLYLLTSSKLYLSQAESSKQSTSFTPFSVILGYMIIELHRHLSLALNDKMVPVLSQVLKCYAALVQATPYHRLNPGLITKVVRSMKHLLQHKDPTIQGGALIVLGCILSSEPIACETKPLFLKTKSFEKTVERDDSEVAIDEDNFSYAEFSSDEDESDSDEKYRVLPWILEKCLHNLNSSQIDKVADQAPAPVRLESAQVISSMCRNFFDCLVYPYLTQIGKSLNECLRDKHADLKLHAGRTIDFIGQSMEQYLNTTGVCDLEKIAPGLSFWQLLMNGSLITLLQSEQEATLKAVGCDCLGSIGSNIFEKLPSEKQILCVTLLFACSRDEESSVRGAALRALGIYVLYKTLREDPGFVVDAAEAIYKSLNDENLGVRMKSSWSLGNLSDALVLNSSNENLELFPTSLLFKILGKSVNACSDNDKVKMNVVRAIGNLLQLITQDLIVNSKFNEIVGLAMNSLIKAATTGSNMKVRWNSCYAIGNVLKNSELYANNPKWIGPVFGALNELVSNFRNFKVRINAALALASPPQRIFYGHYYHQIWSSLLVALENSQNIDDYYEYQHRDNLVEQISLTLAHLISLLEVNDLPLLYESLNSHFHVLLKTHIQRVYDILIPEKSGVLLSASVHLRSLANSNMNAEAIYALTTLRDIFISNF